MLTPEVIDALQHMAVNAEAADLHEQDGITHLIYKGTAKPLLTPLPAALEVSTLNAVVDYIEGNRDGLDIGDLTVVIDAFAVKVLGAVRADGRRVCHLVANEPKTSRDYSSFFGRYMSIEDFLVGAQQRFRAGGQADEMLRLVGNISQSDVRHVADDGVSQEVSVKQGVVKVAMAALPNPVLLIPRRSFPEVALDPVPFVLRVRKTQTLPEVALFEADNGAWMVDAAAKVAAWIKGEWKARKSTATPFAVMA